MEVTMSSNAEKLKKGLRLEQINIDTKKFSIDSDNKFENADKFYQDKVQLEKPKVKLITSTFKVPEGEFNIVNKIIKILVNRNITNIKQTEVFRMALIALDELPSDRVIEIYNNLLKIKTGSNR